MLILKTHPKFVTDVGMLPEKLMEESLNVLTVV